MENVFLYFVAIGAGVSIGLTVGAIPAVMIYRWIQSRGAAHANQIAKRR